MENGKYCWSRLLYFLRVCSSALCSPFREQQQLKTVKRHYALSKAFISTFLSAFKDVAMLKMTGQRKGGRK